MSRELIKRVGRDVDNAIAARPDYAAIAAFAGAFSGCLSTLNLTAFGLAPGIASALATALLSGQLLVTRDETFSGRAFFPALYGGTFGGMTSAFGLSDSASGRSATLTFTLVIVLSIVCGVAFFVVAKLDARSTVSDCVRTRGQIRGHRDFGFLPVHSFGRPHGRGR
jgi:ABC-type transport system involved in multi-copper enzyme maturation permease subunit